jgi:CDP-6-deoxy-D-xylo-4-hexulose-3-dehydrase
MPSKIHLRPAKAKATKANDFLKAEQRRPPIAYTKPIFDEPEITAVLDVLKNGWLGMRDKATELERAISKRIGTAHCRLCNSGSSANLLAITSLEFPKSSEVITPACTFPTTVNPILQNGLIPVFVEVNSGFVLDATLVEQAISPKTKAIVVPHLLGNVANMALLSTLAKQYNLALIEDCCDAFESRWNDKNCGTFGTAGTYSLYASHHFTAAGEGGAVVSNNEHYHNTLQMYRDWGRAGDWTWSQETRYKVKLLDGTPFDDRYYFRVIGYNLKMTEMQAAFALAQMQRLDGFRKRRVANFHALYNVFSEYPDFFQLVAWEKEADPAWFTFPFLVKPNSRFTRNEALAFFQKNGIEGRTLFVGNILLHPAYESIPCRVAGDLSFSNTIAKTGMFIGIGPHMEQNDIAYIAQKIEALCTKALC